MSEKDNISEINIIYDIDDDEDEEITIFGSEFVKNNKDVCKMVIDNREYEITEEFNVKNYYNKRLQIKLKGIDKVTDMSNMFFKCSSLSSLPDISKWNTNKVTDMSYMFFWCKSLSSLPDISKWNTNNVIDMSSMFNMCHSLSSLPDLSKWNINEVTDMNTIFNGCLSLSSLPDNFKMEY